SSRSATAPTRAANFLPSNMTPRRPRPCFSAAASIRAASRSATEPIPSCHDLGRPLPATDRLMHFPDISTGRARRVFGIVAGAMALLATASCSTNEDIASYPCPFVGAVREVSYMTKFAGESQDLSDTLYEAKVDQVLPAVNCIYEDKDGKRAIVYDI